MKTTLIRLALLAYSSLALAFSAADLPRLIVLTDISNEPDDEQSLVRFLVYANAFEVEALVATTSTWLKRDTREDLIRAQIDAYEKVWPNLLVHAPGFPAPDRLRAVTRTGQSGFGMRLVGEGKSTGGSRRIEEVVDRIDPRPVWIALWGGANTLAQALWDVRAERSPEELERFVATLRVYSISDQDDAGPWLRREFPGLFYIVSPSMPDSGEYYRATWTGISGDAHYRNGPGHAMELVSNDWLEENVIRNHGPLGGLYPKSTYIMEGDTVSFLGLIENGLGWSIRPSFGGWGGRYSLYQPLSETRPIWTESRSSRDTVMADNGIVATSAMATVWRWREHFQNDFAARMDWCVADEYSGANHNPIAVVQGDVSMRPLFLSAKSGDLIELTSVGTNDPDGDATRVRWWAYEEAGSLRGVELSGSESPVAQVRIPKVDKPGTAHVILQVEDDGEPRLFAYRRIVINVSL